MPNLNTGILAAVPVVAPPDPVLRAFAVLVERLQDLMVVQEAQNDALATLRNTLLPRLLSGEIELHP